ncbi:MAG: helix-turn-helix transcriptional regulator [Faecousia sp.]
MEESKAKKTGGKKEGQKYKSLIVWNLLLKHTDETHALGISEIKDILEEYGISAERHSVSRDIKDLMELLARDQEVTIQERDLLNYEIEYDPSLHGYKIARRPYEFDDLRLLAECVRASKFISKSQEQHLLAAIENLCSDYQIEELQNEVYLVGRTKTTNKHIMGTMLKINQAIRQNNKISFKYQKYTIQDRTQQVDRRKGAAYVLSPFKLVINDGNYYLLAFDSKKQDIRTYRLDRMKGVDIVTNESREGGAEFSKIDMRTYTQRVFSMYGGEQKRVSMRFINPLLDTVIERFGTGAEVFYRPDDDTHFIVTADVEISDQFYSWICGFRKKALIVSPPDVVADFQKFLGDIQGRYQSE